MRASIRNDKRLGIRAAVLCLLAASGIHAGDDTRPYSVEQITRGPLHHFFGYIGHVGTIPWNESGRYIVALRTPIQDHLPTGDEPADVLLLDTQNDYQPRVIDQTRGWNLQQGTMSYWNPDAPETQLFFNDRDPADGKVFTVLYDVEKGERIREYRFPDTPVGNSGVAQNGGSFLAINYARLARLRPVTGYAGAYDWTIDEPAPQDDGIFKVDVATGTQTLLVSYRRLQQELADDFPEIESHHLFINHTLWNRSDDRIYFFARANFKSRLTKVNVPFTMHADGSHLLKQELITGHPEWDEGNVIIGEANDRQVRYDTDARRLLGPMTSEPVFPKPGGDVALSPDGDWFVNGHKRTQDGIGESVYTFLHRPSGRVVTTDGFSIGAWTSGELRIDPAPCWNRTGDRILFGALDPEGETRQLYVLTLHP